MHSPGQPARAPRLRPACPARPRAPSARTPVPPTPATCRLRTPGPTRPPARLPSRPSLLPRLLPRPAQRSAQRPFLLRYSLCLAIQLLPIQAAAVTIQCLYRDTTCLPSQTSLQYNPFYCNILLAHCNTMTPPLTYYNTNLTYCNTLPQINQPAAYCNTIEFLQYNLGSSPFQIFFAQFFFFVFHYNNNNNYFFSHLFPLLEKSLKITKNHFFSIFLDTQINS